MALVVNSHVFMLGIAVGVLGLVMLLSVVISFAYHESSLLFLAVYLTAMVSVLLAGHYLADNPAWVQNMLLVMGPALVGFWLMWLLRKRTSTTTTKVWVFALLLVNVALLGFILVDSSSLAAPGNVFDLTAGLCLMWGVVLAVAFAWQATHADTAGPWKWYFMLGHALGLVVALLFLTNVVNAQTPYWPVVLMLLAQLPPMYLSLVWRSRLLNEVRLRSSGAAVIDPLTGLSTAPVFIERLMRITARNAQEKTSQTSNALYLIEVQNWQILLNELGADFNERLLLESAMRLRRAVNDNDMVARISGGRFAVVAQNLANHNAMSEVATRLLVSGLRTDSTQLAGVELKFRIIVLNLKLFPPLSVAVTKAWLDSLVGRFEVWPSSHRSRSILVINEGDVTTDPFQNDSNY